MERSFNGSASEAAERDPQSPEERRLARRLGLRRTSVDALTISRVRCGRGFAYVDGDGNRIRDPRVTRRLAKLAVPPAYENVLYARDPDAHLQAVGRDAAGRLQYRYHPDWQKIREWRKAQRLLRLVETLPRIRRAMTQHLAAGEPCREHALAAAIELVAVSAIRAGSEAYAREHGTRGAATLLKSNVTIADQTVLLSFRGKGGKRIAKELHAPRLAAAIGVLSRLPGRRLFQYRDADGAVRAIRARDINAFLHSVAGARISLKDFRTLCATARVLDRLAQLSPAPTERQRKRQVLDAIREAADDLANTPAICRKSYVHETVLDAFETGALEKYAAALKSARKPGRRAQLMARVLAGAAPVRTPG
ncbi:MAG TPA: DNA topoisomerase IB [Xanthobacteraceae bacterium]|nr:DNA topoisomerase IB [Xanthobacteraceae bacterium]